MSTARRKDLVMVAIGLLVILVDQLTKHWIVAYFTPFHPPVPILGDVLELQYVQNGGVAFSMLDGQSLKFLFIAVAIAVIGYLYWQNRERGSLLLKVSFGLVLGGAVGNLIDRFTLQYVVDFIHFQIPGHFDFAVFNIADSGITVGVLLLAYLLWREGYLTKNLQQPAANPPAGSAGDAAADDRQPHRPSAQAQPSDSARPSRTAGGVTSGQ